ncbi:MAG: S41 family peptidase, partial [Kangiellaceae bacterium]|nr:S41 family peptidase [Kangiellaceae bacterium]
MNKNTFKLTYGLIFLTLLSIIGCGSGGGGSSTIEKPSASQPNWAANVFEDETQFKNLCQTPRTGTDPFSGNAFPDRAGKTLQENHWLRSWSDNTYLWYNEIIDRNPISFSDTESYFDQLKTQATTNSGQEKDKFHFTFDTAEWQQLNQSGISAGYGVEWAIVQSSPPRQILIAFTEPDTPASNVNLLRGSEILEVDGVDVVNAGDQASVDIINAAFFPSDLGETHQFVLREVGATNTRSVSMTSQEITSSPVQNVASFDTINGKVGYLFFNSHIATAETQLVGAINQLKTDGVTDLVLDLRYNGGGLLAIASQLAYMIAGPAPTNNQTFDDLVFND